MGIDVIVSYKLKRLDGFLNKKGIYKIFLFLNFLLIIYRIIVFK